MKFSCGHRADTALTKVQVLQVKWCLGCDPRERAKREKAEREAQQRNRRTQRDLDRIGMGRYGPNPDQEHITWKPTPEQLMNAVRAFAMFGPALRDLEDEPAAPSPAAADGGAP